MRPKKFLNEYRPSQTLNSPSMPTPGLGVAGDSVEVWDTASGAGAGFWISGLSGDSGLADGCGNSSWTGGGDSTTTGSAVVICSFRPSGPAVLSFAIEVIPRRHQ